MCSSGIPSPASAGERTAAVGAPSPDGGEASASAQDAPNARVVIPAVSETDHDREGQHDPADRLHDPLRVQRVPHDLEPAGRAHVDERQRGEGHRNRRGPERRLGDRGHGRDRLREPGRQDPRDDRERHGDRRADRDGAADEAARPPTSSRPARIATSRTFATSIPNRVAAAAMNAACVVSVTTPNAWAPRRVRDQHLRGERRDGADRQPEHVLAGLADDQTLVGAAHARSLRCRVPRGREHRTGRRPGIGSGADRPTGGQS